MGWQMHFDATNVFVTPNGTATAPTAVSTPDARRAPPAGSFLTVTSVRGRITADAAGANPIPVGGNATATLELISRIKRTTPAGGWQAIGVMNGRITFATRPTPAFICGTRSGPLQGTVRRQVNDFTPDAANEVARSDWIVTLESHINTFQFSVAGIIQLQLPWLFNEANPTLQLSARLRVGGAVAFDENRNTPLDIPLTCTRVPEDLATAPTAEKLTLFGVRTIMPSSLIRVRPPLGANRLLVFIHPSLSTFVTANCAASPAPAPTPLEQMRASIRTTLADVGFPNIDIVMTGDATFAAQQTRFQAQFQLITPTTTPPSPPLPSRFCSTRLANPQAFLRTGVVGNGEGSVIPFFDFFIALENRDPPNQIDLGEAERFTAADVNVAAATKRVATPILLFAGASASRGIRGALGKTNTADGPNLIANIVCHEIGHSLGLRHGVTFDGSTPYASSDNLSSQNSVMYIAAILQANTGTGNTNPCRTNFFGPVQRNALRAAYTIP